MQPCSREMQGLQNQHQQQIQSPHFDPSSSSNEDFLEQMLSTIPSGSWADLKSPCWDLNPTDASAAAATTTTTGLSLPIHNGAAKLPVDLSEETAAENDFGFRNFDESALLAAKLRLHQISGGVTGTVGEPSPVAAAKMMLQQQLMMAARGGLQSQNDVVDGSSFNSTPSQGGPEGSMQALYGGFGAGSMTGASQVSSQSQQHLHNPQGGGAMQAQNFGDFGASGALMNQSQASGSTGGGAPPQPKPRVRARRGQATDPHSIAERLRRERIAERMKALQELVPNANKTDKASMLDEIIDYVKFLQLQVKVLSMSRLGGAAAVAPLVADMSSEGGGGDCIQASTNDGYLGRGSNGKQAPSSNDSQTVTEHQVAKLMEENMGSAMQYLQGKGLCLMPISLATAISTATGQGPRNVMISNADVNNNGSGNGNHPLLRSNGEGPTSPSMSVLTVQSATMGNGTGDVSVKDAASVSKP